MSLPGILVHICFPDRKKREVGGVRTRSIGAIYQQKKVITQTFFRFSLRSHSLELHACPLIPVPTDHTNLLPCLLASGGGGRVARATKRLRVGSAYFLPLPAGPQSASEEVGLQRPQPTSSSPLLQLGSHRYRQSPSPLTSLSISHWFLLGFPSGANGKEFACQCRRPRRCGFNPWVEQMPGRGHGNPLQYSCQGNPWIEEPGGL